MDLQLPIRTNGNECSGPLSEVQYAKEYNKILSEQVSYDENDKNDNCLSRV